MISAGSQAFAVVVRRIGGPAIAARLGVTRGAVHNWATARKMPTPTARRAIATHYGIATELWEAQATAGAGAEPKPARAAPAKAPPRPAAAEKPRSAPSKARADDADPVAVCKDTIRRLRRELERLDGDKLSTSKERAQLSSALTQATRLLAKLTGSLEISQSQILRSPHWRKLLEGLGDALRPVPGASKAAAEYFRGLDG